MLETKASSQPHAPSLEAAPGAPGALGRPGGPALLEVRGLTATYGATQVLHGIDFTLAAGRITAILGANGAGKTTTLRAICQTVATAGSLRFEGRELVGQPTESVVRLGIAHVPDGRGTFGALTVEENLRLGGYLQRDKARVAEDIEQAYLRFPRLRERKRQPAGLLSGGEQQMLAISRALMLRPRLLLLDEPSFGLAPLIVADIFRTLRALNEREGTSILLVEQNARLALELADRAYLLETGRVALAGSSAEIQRDEAVRRAYLGY